MSNKYFLGLEKLRYSNKTMKQLIEDDGSIERDQKKILMEQVNFYRKLYTSNSNVFFEYENKMQTKLTTDDKNNLGKDISLDELSQALYSMPNNKSPGLNGLPAEVYKVFWSKIKHYYFKAIKACIKDKILTPGMRKGLLCLIPKPRDPSYLKTWRPLTLMDIGHKIFAKTIARRVKPVLQYLISQRQMGYMEKCFIGMNLRKIMDIIEYYNNSNTPALMISIDFMKCFDMIEFSATEGAMCFFNFGEKIISYVNLLYTKFETAIVHNGCISEFFHPTWGIHQGCPQSGYNLLINAEILAQKISQNSKVHKVSIDEQEIEPVSQFIDDMTLFIQHDQQSMEEIVKVFEDFRINTGLTISYEKTTISRLGPLRNTNYKLKLGQKFKWQDTNIIALGVAIDQPTDENQSYNQLIEKMMSIISTWQQRHISLIGKINVLNSLVGSLLVYKMQVLPTISTSLTVKINRLLEKFIWNGRKPKIKLETLQKPKADGGMSLFDPIKKDKALKIQWVLRLPDMTNDASKLAYYHIRPLIQQNFWMFNFAPQHVMYICEARGFWKSAVVAWVEYHFYEVNDVNQVLNQYIFCNSHITIAHKPITNKVYTTAACTILELINPETN